MSIPLPTGSSDDLVPLAPSAERWAAMTTAERDAFLAESLAALNHEASLMAEGSPHITARTSAFLVLRDYFVRIGRKVYVRSELPVHYPGERVFAPDLMAVLDVADAWQEDTRMAWVVAQEGKGLDFVLEVLHAGDPQKDLLDNVARYARMGIPEYFVYDRRKQRILGYRLPFPESDRYTPMKAHGGLLSSRVLGLELAIEGGRLRFSQGGSVVLETPELMERVNAMMDELESKLEAEAEARIAAEQRAEALERRIAELLARTGER